MTATKPPARLALLVSVAIVLGSYGWAWWSILHVDATPGPLPFLVGAAALPLLLVTRAAATVGRALVAMALLVSFSLIAPAPIVASFDAGVAAFIVCAGTLLPLWLRVSDFRDDDDDDGPTGGAGGTGDRIVGLSGYAGAGKDTAAAGLLEDGWTRVAFADKLREFALAVDPLVPSRVEHVEVDGTNAPTLRVERLSSYVARVGGWTEAKRNPEVRALLQRIGTDAGRRVLGDNVWVDAALRDRPAGNVVVTDVRFPNEAAAILDAGGSVVRVFRPGTVPVNPHPSETAMDGHRFDTTVVNNGSPDRLGDALREAVTHTA